MQAVYYTCRGKTYKVAPTREVDKHFEVVKDLIGATDPEEYKARMHTSVEQGLACEITVNGEYGGHYYNVVTDEGKCHGCSIYSCGDIVVSLLLFKTMTDNTSSRTIKINPHNDEDLAKFVSVATGSSIRSWHKNKGHLNILVDDIASKGLKMYKYLGVEECQQ